MRRFALPCRNWKLFALDLFFLSYCLLLANRRAGLPSKYTTTLDALILNRGKLPSASCGPLLALGTWTEPSLLPRMSDLLLSDRQTDLLFSHHSTLYALSALPCFYLPGAVASSCLLVVLAPSCWVTLSPLPENRGLRRDYLPIIFYPLRTTNHFQSSSDLKEYTAVGSGLCSTSVQRISSPDPDLDLIDGGLLWQLHRAYWLVHTRLQSHRPSVSHPSQGQPFS